MIVYNKLANLLKERDMTWRDLCNAGIGINTPAKFSHNRPLNTDILNRVCEYLKVQPSEIMEWVPDSEYEKKNAEKQLIEKQIAELQERLKNL